MDAITKFPTVAQVDAEWLISQQCERYRRAAIKKFLAGEQTSEWWLDDTLRRIDRLEKILLNRAQKKKD